MKVALVTLGCKVNQYESQLMREKISELGVDFVPFGCIADFYIINTCTVTKRSDQKAHSLIRRAKRKSPSAFIIVTGCYVKRADCKIKEIFSDIIILPNEEKRNVVKYILGNKKIKQRVKEGISRFTGHNRAFVKIQDGCDAFCSYCIIPYVRNRIFSRSPYRIVEEIKRLTANGYKEIVLVGIRLGRYQWEDIKLARLIEDISEIATLRRIRLSSIEPQDINEELLEVLRDCPKVCSHLHIPLQSGDEEILRKMRRNYSPLQYEELVGKIREKLLNIAITTDVIVGFPGEKDENFNRGFEFIKKIAFSKLHVFKFSVREETLASQFKERVDPFIIKERSKKLLKLSKTLHEKFIQQSKGKIEEVLIENKKKGSFIGFSGNYIKVKLIPNMQVKSNHLLKVKIVGIEGRYAKGMVV